VKRALIFSQPSFEAKKFIKRELDPVIFNQDSKSLGPNALRVASGPKGVKKRPPRQDRNAPRRAATDINRGCVEIVGTNDPIDTII
jgi:hypothetical protein